MNKLRKIRLKAGAKAVLFGLMLFAIIGFVERRQDVRTCQGVSVNIDNDMDNYFIDNKDMLALMTIDGSEMLEGAEIDQIDLKKLEKRLRSHQFVENAQVYRDIGGHLRVDVSQRRPIARLMPRNEPDRYISADGQLLPMSNRFTARVPIITGAGADALAKSNFETDTLALEMVQLLQLIDADPFWRAQIAGIDYSRDRELTLYPQVTGQVIEFGEPKDIRRKLKKLQIFYKEILPAKGWNTYSRVNLEFENQIICE